MFDKLNPQEMLLVQSSVVVIGLGILLIIFSYFRDTEGVTRWTTALFFWGCIAVFVWLFIGDSLTFRPNLELVSASLCFAAIGALISVTVIRQKDRFWQLWFVPFAVLALNASTLLVAPFIRSLHLHLP